jgi:coenzyme F420-reducing hydrogenase delta subunit/Pyruvate/2-oxoacid:ferredoxin oxidoreductase delta subunit
MLLHPAVDRLSAGAVWWLSLGITVLLMALPVWPGRASPAATALAPIPQPAEVDLGNCNGCGRCVADCPFGAVVMVARTDGLHHRQQASVIPDLCAACGICVGSCPSSTPFRRLEEIVSGIELPHKTVGYLRQQLQQRLAALTGPQRIMLFTCGQATDWSALADASTAVLPLECAGMLPPSFIEYALRSGADGVVITGCREGDCEFRLGDRWVRNRLTGAREPRLRAAAPRERIAVVWAGNQRAAVEEALATLRVRMAHGQCTASSPTTPTSDAIVRESDND